MYLKCYISYIYLLSKNLLEHVDEIKNLLRDKRSIVNPIENFVDQLELYYAKLNPIEINNDKFML